MDGAGNAGDWLQVGSWHLTYGVERALMAFNTTSIGEDLTVTAARFPLHQVGGSGSGATVELRDLAQSFDEGQADWIEAKSTIPWATQGGDFRPGQVASLTTSSAPKVLTLTGTNTNTQALRTAVQGWVDTPTSNHGDWHSPR